MAKRGRSQIDRRTVLRGLAGGVALTGGAARSAFGDPTQDAALQALIRQNQQSDFGQTFDSASRTIVMPKSSLPTLSPATAQQTAQAIAQYEAIVTRGGWPQVPPTERLRLGNRHGSVVPLRARLTA